MGRSYTIFLRNDYLSQPITTAKPVSRPSQDSPPLAGRRRDDSHSLEDFGTDISILADLRVTRQNLSIENFLDRCAQRFAEPDTLAACGSHTMIRQDDQVVLSSACHSRHSPDLRDASVSSTKVCERLL